MTPLMLAIREGHDDIALKLIETATTETLNNISFEGYTAMTLACSENNESVLSALLQRADLELNPSNCEYTPLLHASLHKNEALVNALVKKGASVNHTNKDGVTALLVAVENDDFKLVELFITLGADVDKVRFSDGKTPLIVAIEKGNLELASKLVECDVNVNHIDLSGISPLRLAFKNGQVDFVRKLLAHGADESLVSDMIEYKKYKKIEGLIQYIADNSANEITCPISFGSLVVDGYVVSDNERSPAFSSGVGNGIYSENNLRRWLSSSFNDPLTRDNISSNTLIDISRDIAAYFDPLITKMITEISDLPNEEKIALGLTELTQGSDQLLLSSSDALYAKLSQLPVHEFTTLRSKLVNLNKEHVQELGIVQQRSQSFDQNIPIMADTGSYAEVKGYDPGGNDASNAESLSTKVSDEKEQRDTLLSEDLSEENDQSQSNVKKVESSRQELEKKGIER
ncbi:ankyrin repeat domain-containing protein [Rickettsiales bacterium]|nr:ankyrin repeat domain-containing protein [Rickettsiales bacterium]